MILPDSSAWIEFDRKTGSPVHVRLRELLQGGPVCTTEPVIMEVLSGARDDLGEARLRKMLRRVPLLPFLSPADFEAAQRTYRLCRRRGITPRGLLDCMIASVAMRHGAAVLTRDADFARMADAVALDLDPASTRPE